MAVRLEVDTHGPLFNGVLHRQISRALEDARGEVGDYGTTHVRARFRRVLRHDSPEYRSGRREPGTLAAAVDVQEMGDTVRIHNGDVIYRFWIEGTGSRNKTTRFKGYFTFRKVAQEVRRAAPRMVRDALARIPGVGR